MFASFNRFCESTPLRVDRRQEDQRGHRQQSTAQHIMEDWAVESQQTTQNVEGVLMRPGAYEEGEVG